MTERLYLIVSLAGQTVALPTADIESVVELDEVTAVPRVANHVAGLFALRSRVLTVIDGAAALGLGRSGVGPRSQAVIVTLDGYPYALLVDAVHDVVSAPSPIPAPAILGGGWAAASLGAIGHEGSTLLLVDPACLIRGPGTAHAA